MLIESHPLYKAEAFLLLLFEKAPPKHWIEFTAIRDGGNKADPKEIHVEAAQVHDLERSFDLTIADWVQKHSKNKFHCYFGVCPRESMPRGSRGGYPARAAKGNITHSVCAWMDYDKPTWREVAQSDPKPTFVVSTGHGAHFYYRYADAVPIEKATSDTKLIASLFGGDNTCDAPRVLRIPGTRNWKEPDKELIAQLEDSDPEVVFSGKVEVPADGATKPKTVSDLPFDLRTVIFGGYSAAVDPFIAFKEGTQELDQSKIDARVMLHLFQFGFDEDKIRSIFTNPEYGISKKTLDDEAKKGNSENYLRRSIDWAKLEYQKKSLQYDMIGESVEFETLHDLAKAPPLRFAVDYILPFGGFMTISGAAKIGKSLAVSELALRLAGAPGKFLGQFGVNHHGPVAYCQAEVSKSSLDRRFLTICAEAMKLQGWRDLPIHLLNKKFDLADPRHVMVITNGLKRVKAEFLIIDPLSRFHSENENKQREMAMILSSIDRIKASAGLVGVVLVHHFGKPSADAPRQGAHMMRGASVIGDWGNSHVLMEKHWNEVTGKKFSVISFELRDAEEPSPLTMAINRDKLILEPYSMDDEYLPIIKGAIDQSDLSPKDRIDLVSEKTGLSRNKAAQAISRIKREIREAKEEEAADAGETIEPEEEEEAESGPPQENLTG